MFKVQKIHGAHEDNDLSHGSRDPHDHNTVTYILILAIIALAIFTYWYWTTNIQLMSRMGNFVQIVTVFSMLVGGIIAIITLKYQVEDRERALNLQYANITQNAVNDIDKTFMSNSMLDRLYFEMYADMPQIKRIKRMKEVSEVTPEMLKQEHHMSNIIFQKIADIYFCESLNTCSKEDAVEWLNTFKRWLKSPVLQSHWVHLKREHHPEVQKFIDNLIAQT